MKKIICILLTVALVGCGTTSSLETKNAIPYARIKIADTLEITGRLLQETNSKLTIAVDGVSQEYLKSEIKSFEIVMQPYEKLMMDDIVRNSSNKTDKS